MVPWTCMNKESPRLWRNGWLFSVSRVLDETSKPFQNLFRLVLIYDQNDPWRLISSSRLLVLLSYYCDPLSIQIVIVMV